ncbi:MAG: molybdopterin-dependent oxidoreductase [Bryobacterales bacterium]|nr:molybdopterin-dependent oxidoreductase [Bryobacterales bacterium]
MQRASLAALIGLLFHFVSFWVFGTPLLTDLIAEWIMARTPSRYALWILDTFGTWAKPFAATGGLAVLGAVLWAASFFRRPARIVAACAVLSSALTWLLDYPSLAGALFFWLPAMAVLLWPGGEAITPSVASRRSFLLSSIMSAGTAAVAVESYLRNEAFSRKAAVSVPLDPFTPPVEQGKFAPPIVRPAVTSVNEFYGMSKNTVDPVIDPDIWRLRITVDGKPLRQYRYSELLGLPRTQRYATLRCISNTLRSNLMGNALWSGIHFSQLVDRAQLPAGVVEAAVIGVDGHGDSYPLEYVFSEHAMLALGMNGKTLNRTHGFPIRLLAPRYFGFKSVKWIDEIRFVTQPYFGTWPKMGYTKEARVHTFSYIDRILESEQGFQVGGIAVAGDRGIRRVQIRADQGDWIDAELEAPLSPYTWTRWRGLIPLKAATTVEARAQDGLGNWQATEESPLFPSGVSGPTIRRI